VYISALSIIVNNWSASKQLVCIKGNVGVENNFQTKQQFQMTKEISA
jgi:hypothetical protein